MTGFRVCGMWPVNDDVFTDDDFEAAEVTEEPDPTSATISAINVPTQTAPPTMDSELQIQAFGLSYVII